MFDIERTATTNCIGCKHPIDLHTENGCAAFSRGDDMRMPTPCACYRVGVETSSSEPRSPGRRRLKVVR